MPKGQIWVVHFGVLTAFPLFSAAPQLKPKAEKGGIRGIMAE
jgi:hypothetical protein